jgi:signal transduction histidine kinase
VSHELRSPITQIRLKAEALHLGLTRGVSDEREHYAAIVRQAEHLSRLVDNVLDFSAIERGVKRYTFRPEPLDAVLLKALQTQDDAAREAGLRLTLDMPDVTPTLHMDREAIGQVFTNLLSNAIKYGSDGETVDVVAAWIDDDTVDIAVTDHGIGIAPEDQVKVFDHFFRVSSTDVRRRRGTGIGLTIVRYIVEAHGGTITVDSRLGQGSTFRVTLPLHPPDDLGG